MSQTRRCLLSLNASCLLLFLSLTGMSSTPLVMILLLGIMAESGVLVIIISLLARFRQRHRISFNDVVPIDTIQKELTKDHLNDNSDSFKAENVKQPNKKEQLRKGNNYWTDDKVDILCFLLSFTLTFIFVVSMLSAMDAH